jgi:hypothetical protein
MRRTALYSAVALAALVLSACGAKPRAQNVQWVARDAWNSSCAELAIVEVWKAGELKWKEKGESLTVDVDAKFKLTNDCDAGGATLKAYTSFPFKQTIEMHRCEVEGKSGWSLPGMQKTRCWAGPKPVGEELAPVDPSTIPKEQKDAAKQQAAKATQKAEQLQDAMREKAKAARAAKKAAKKEAEKASE